MSTSSEAAPTFDGRYSDGRTAAAVPVSIAFGADGLIIQAGAAAPFVWPYERLLAAAPLESDSIDALLALRDRPGATLFVAGQEFPTALRQRAPHLTPRSEIWRGLRPGLVVTALVLLIAATVYLLGLHPAQAVARLMPERTRAALGSQVVASLAHNRKLCEDPAARAALNRLVARLLAGAGTPMQAHVVVLDWSLVNAFAAPGGQVILTNGLIQQAKSPDEVAGVLAHEFGHVIELHPETSLVRAMGLSTAAQLIFGGSPSTLANIGIVLAQLRYTRRAEREADAHGLRLLRQAGISAAGIVDFFERVEGKRKLGGVAKTLDELEFIRTHPLTSERIAKARAQPDYPASPALSPQDWQALRGACRKS
jgi:predicted Zn-dependent protease